MLGLDKDRSFIKWHNRRGIAWLHNRGYVWFSDRYLPAVKRIEAAGINSDARLLSDSHYLIGDIHDFNKAPRAAIRAYQKSFSLDPTAGALREIAAMHNSMGDYRKARNYARRALVMDPADQWVGYELDAAETGGEPVYKNGDVLWEAHELLAQAKFKAVLKELSGMASVQARQLRISAYGGLRDTEGVQAEWRAIARTKGPILLDYVDWYYIDYMLWDSLELFKILYECRERFWDDEQKWAGVWPLFESLYSVIPNPKGSRVESKASLRRISKCRELWLRFHIARLEHDKQAMNELAAEYPTWPEPSECARKWQLFA